MIATCTTDARCPRHMASGGTPSDIDPCGALLVPEMRGEDFRRLARVYGEEARDLQEGTAPPDLIHYLAERVQDLASMLCEADARLGRAEKEASYPRAAADLALRENSRLQGIVSELESANKDTVSDLDAAERERDDLRAKLALARAHIEMLKTDVDSAIAHKRQRGGQQAGVPHLASAPPSLLQYLERACRDALSVCDDDGKLVDLAKSLGWAPPAAPRAVDDAPAAPGREG